MFSTDAAEGIEPGSSIGLEIDVPVQRVFRDFVTTVLAEGSVVRVEEPPDRGAVPTGGRLARIAAEFRTVPTIDFSALAS